MSYTTFTGSLDFARVNIVTFSDMGGVCLLEWLPQVYIPARMSGEWGFTPFAGSEHNTVRCFYALSTARKFLEEQAK